MKMSGRKLNFLLVMPRLVQSIGDGYVFPLGVAYVSSHGGQIFCQVKENHQGITEIIDICQLVGFN